MASLVSPVAEGEEFARNLSVSPSAAGETITRIAEIALSEGSPTVMPDGPRIIMVSEVVFGMVGRTDKVKSFMPIGFKQFIGSILCFGFIGCFSIALAEEVIHVTPKEASQVRSVEVNLGFRVEPMTVKISGIAGERLPFKFIIESYERDCDIEIFPVRLKQYIDGTILFDNTLLPPSTEIEPESPATFHLDPNRNKVIEGMIRVPEGKSAFYTYGLLVSDIPKSSANSQEGTPNTRTAAKILYKTQYLLRIDVSVRDRKSESAEALQIRNPKFVDVDGRPILQMELANPTESTFDFSAEMNFAMAGTGIPKKSLRLSTISRRERGIREDQKNSTIRILPGASIVLEGAGEELMDPGKYDAEVEIVVSDEAVKKPLELLVENGRVAQPEDDNTSMPAVGNSVAETSIVSHGSVEFGFCNKSKRNFLVYFRRQRCLVSHDRLRSCRTFRHFLRK